MTMEMGGGNYLEEVCVCVFSLDRRRVKLEVVLPNVHLEDRLWGLVKRSR